jgi:thiamine transport system permease protein
MKMKQFGESAVKAELQMTSMIDIVFLLPLGVSTIVLGFGYLITFGSGWFPLRSSWLVVPLVQGLMAIPAGLLTGWLWSAGGGATAAFATSAALAGLAATLLALLVRPPLPAPGH